MPTQYPGAIDALTNPTAADTLAAVPHDQQHANANDAVEAIEGKLGTGASTPTTAGHVLKVTGSGATAFGALSVGDVSGAASTASVSEKVDKTGGGKETVYTVPSSGAALTVNFGNGNFQDITLTANCTLSLAGATLGVACGLTVLLRQDGTGGRTVTWPGAVAWPGSGAAPTLETGAAAVDVITLFTVDGGTTYYAFHSAGAPPAAGPDLSALTIERSIQAISDYVAGYDASAADERGFPVGQLRLGRGHSVVADECFMNGTADVFEGGVTTFVSGAGAAIVVGTAEANHPGVVTISTGTTAAGYCAFGNPNGTLIRLGGGKVRVGIVAKLTTLSDGTDTYTARLGLQEAFATDSVDGVYFRYTHGTNAGEWQGVARSNSVESALDTNALADTNWHTFELEVNAAGTSVEFFIDGVSKGTIATNIPTGAGRETGLIPAVIVKSLGTAARTLSVDAYWAIFEFSTAR